MAWNLPDNVTQRDIDARSGSGLSEAADNRLDLMKHLQVQAAATRDLLISIQKEDPEGEYDDAIAALDNTTLPSLNVRIRDIAQWDADQSAPDYDAIRDLRRAA